MIAQFCPSQIFLSKQKCPPPADPPTGATWSTVQVERLEINILQNLAMLNLQIEEVVKAKILPKRKLTLYITPPKIAVFVDLPASQGSNQIGRSSTQDLPTEWKSWMAISHLPDTKGNQSYALSALMRDVQKAQKWRVNKQKQQCTDKKRAEEWDIPYLTSIYLSQCSNDQTNLPTVSQTGDGQNQKYPLQFRDGPKADPTGSIQTINLPITTYCLW